MNQPDGGRGGPRQPFRKSLLSQNKDTQVMAQVNCNGELLRRLSTSFQQGRLSNPPQGGNISFAPTPGSLRRPPINHPARKGISSLPRPSIVPVKNQKQQQQPGPSSSAAKSSLKRGAATSVTNIPQLFSGPRGSSRPPNAKIANVGHPVVSALKKSSIGGLRRSASVDATQWSLNSMITPTPARSARTKSPMSMRRWGSSGDVGGMPGIKIKIPSSSNKEVIHHMSTVIIEFMAAQSYNSAPMNPREMSKMSSKDYYKMVQFVAQFLVGPQFLQEGDMAVKISELAILLRYGAALSKSHLKSVGAPNSLPACLVFLCWLCSRTGSVVSRMNEVNNPNPMNELKDDGWSQFSRENLLTIFYCERSTWSLSTDDKTHRLQETVNKEVAAFCQRFRDTYMSESDYSMEDLHVQRKEKLQELAEIEAKPDLARDTVIALEAVKQKVIEMNKKAEETKKKITTYKDMHSLRSKIEAVRLDMQNANREIQTLKAEISNQPLDKQGEKRRLKEIENFRQQRDCLQTMLDKLNMDLEKERQANRNLDGRVRNMMTQFTVVETCNASLANLNLHEFMLPANPMNADGFTTWLDTADVTLHKAAKAIEKTIIAIKQDQQEIELKDQKISNETNDLRKQFSMIQHRVAQLVDTINTSAGGVENRLGTNELRYQELCNNLSHEKRLTEELKRQSEEFQSQSGRLQEEILKKSSMLTEWEQFMLEYEVKVQMLRIDMAESVFRDFSQALEAYNGYLTARRERIQLQKEIRDEIRQWKQEDL